MRSLHQFFRYLSVGFISWTMGIQPSMAKGNGADRQDGAAIFFMRQALSLPDAVEPHSPLVPSSRIGYVHKEIEVVSALLPRRQFLRGAAAAYALRLLPGGVLLGWFASIKNLQAQPYKTGVGSVLEQPINFHPYSANKAEANPDLQTALKALDAYITLNRVLFSRIAQDRLTVEAIKQVHQKRNFLVKTLWMLPTFRARLIGHLKTLNIPLATTEPMQTNQILYAGLPAFLADYGLLMEINFPQIDTPEFYQSGVEQMYILERWTVSPVDAVDRSTLSLWNHPVTAANLTISGIFSFQGHRMTFSDAPIQENARTIYRNNVFFTEGMQRSLMNEKRVEALTDPKVLELLNIEWEQAPLKYENDPLGFSYDRLRAEEMIHPISDADRVQWMDSDQHYHERQHLQDTLRGLYPFVELETSNWPIYDDTINKRHVLREIHARITAAHYTAPEYQRHELLFFLASFKILSSRGDRLQYFNLLDLLLTHLSEHWSEYPELKIQLVRPLRFQIAGQLYRLKPESLARAWGAVHVDQEAPTYTPKMPIVVEPRALMIDSVATPSSRIHRPARKALRSAS